MIGRRHRQVVAAGLPLVLLCALASSAADAHRRCWDCDIPYEWEDGEPVPPFAAPYPQGFALTVPITLGRTEPAPPATLDRYATVAAALGACLSAELPPRDAAWRDMTLRVSFRRDGAINGEPRIAHVSDAPSADAAAKGRAAMLAALSRCAPLPFSSSLGRAIAGQIFAIRFVQQRNS